MNYDAICNPEPTTAMTTPTPVAIASESPYTVDAGVALADSGGNAADIAVGAALEVFMVYHLPRWTPMWVQDRVIGLIASLN